MASTAGPVWVVFDDGQAWSGALVGLTYAPDQASYTVELHDFYMTVETEHIFDSEKDALAWYAENTQ